MRIVYLLLIILAPFIANSQDFPEMVKVEGGKFLMGDTHIVGFSDELPPQPVLLNGFHIGKTEVTVKQWRKYTEETSKEMPSEPGWGWADDLPIANISFDEATAYCNWLSEKTGKKYRLPTEAEWEYAAKGGKKGKGFKYSGGQWLDSVGWFSTNSSTKTHAVAQKKANELGLYDMSGNVMEWTQDWGTRPFTTSEVSNPTGNEKGTSIIVKGGAYSFASSINRISYRLSWPPTTKRMQLGLRVVYTD